MKLRTFDQIEVERLRRAQACFKADQPTRGEVVRAMRRWEHGRTQKSLLNVRRPSLWVFAAVSLLTGATLAATGALKLPIWSLRHSPVEQAPSASKPKPKKLSTIVVHRGGQRLEYNQSINLSLLDGEHASLQVGGNSTELVGPVIARVRPSQTDSDWVTSFEHRSPAPAVEPRDSVTTKMDAPESRPEPAPVGTQQRPLRPADTHAAGAASSARSDKLAVLEQAQLLAAPSIGPAPSSELTAGAWTRAASALRVGNESAAISALSELSQSNDAATRDAALLAKAQLDWAAGRRANASPVLQRLAVTGATAFVRRRASEILTSEQK